VISGLKYFSKYFLLLLAFAALILISCKLFSLISGISLNIGEICIQTFIFVFIAGITLYIFFRGQAKEPGSRTFHSMVAISLKFILEMIFALFWFLVVKKCYTESVIMFFVLYLSLTSFSIFIILKTLKNKAL